MLLTLQKHPLQKFVVNDKFIVSNELMNLFENTTYIFLGEKFIKYVDNFFIFRRRGPSKEK